jgi:hypothetical protein
LKITIEYDTGNADVPTVPEMLRNVADQIAMAWDYSSESYGVIRDLNGNRIGTWVMREGET